MQKKMEQQRTARGYERHCSKVAVTEFPIARRHAVAGSSFRGIALLAGVGSSARPDGYAFRRVRTAEWLDESRSSTHLRAGDRRVRRYFVQLDPSSCAQNRSRIVGFSRAVRLGGWHDLLDQRIP